MGLFVMHEIDYAVSLDPRKIQQLDLDFKMAESSVKDSEVYPNCRVVAAYKELYLGSKGCFNTECWKAVLPVFV